MSLVFERDPAIGGPTPADSRVPDARWYAGLLAPVQGRVSAALAHLPADRGPIPREGLGTAVAALIARGFGARRWQEGARVAAVALEGWNYHVHVGFPEGQAREAWLRAQAGRIRRVHRSVDDARLARVIDLLLDGAGDEAVPESVLLLRGAVAAGALCGDVPAALHARLDRFAAALGHAWEAALSSPWAAVPREQALLDARAALADLPDGEPTERLAEALDRLPTLDGDRRTLRAWIPRSPPLLRAPPAGPLAPTPTPGPAPTAPLEAALTAAVTTDSRPMARAAAFLQHQGGKRARPLMVLAAASACGAPADAALRPAALLEWLHQASLVIDDVIDEARLRRDAPTLHHATSEPFALGVAAWLLARIHVGARSLDPAVRAALSDAALALAEGQRAELAHTGDPDLPLSAYYRIIEAKTARLFACAAALGGHAAGARPATIAALSRYGREAGLAFQVVDDVLDYVGDERRLGKRPGADLRAHKVTLPLLLLRDRLDPAGRAALARRLAGDPEAIGFADVRASMARHGVAEDCLERARTHRDRALDALSAVPAGPGREQLAALAGSFVERSR